MAKIKDVKETVLVWIYNCCNAEVADILTRSINIKIDPDITSCIAATILTVRVEMNSWVSSFASLKKNQNLFHVYFKWHKNKDDIIKSLFTH